MFGISKGVAAIVQKHMVEAETRIRSDIEKMFSGTLQDLAGKLDPKEEVVERATRHYPDPLPEKAAMKVVMELLKTQGQFSYREIKQIKPFKGRSYFQVFNFIRVLRTKGVIRREGQASKTIYRSTMKATSFSTTAN
jgi:hypothetical protein